MRSIPSGWPPPPTPPPLARERGALTYLGLELPARKSQTVSAKSWLIRAPLSRASGGGVGGGGRSLISCHRERRRDQAARLQVAEDAGEALLDGLAVAEDGHFRVQRRLVGVG